MLGPCPDGEGHGLAGTYALHLDDALVGRGAELCAWYGSYEPVLSLISNGVGGWRAQRTILDDLLHCGLAELWGPLNATLHSTYHGRGYQLRVARCRHDRRRYVSECRACMRPHLERSAALLAAHRLGGRHAVGHAALELSA
jgi:hypothetical protein